jgi:hypothetical protein
MSLCGITQCPRFVGHNEHGRPECLRQEDHEGEHLGKDADGQYVIYWRDIACSCESCQSDSPADWCEPFSHVPKEKAMTLLASPAATLLDWGAEKVALKESP